MAHRRYQGHLRGREINAYREWLRTEIIVCHECGINRATIPDHDPPVSTFPHPSLWSGRYLPHCRKCADRQGAMMRWQRAKTPSPTREW